MGRPRQRKVIVGEGKRGELERLLRPHAAPHGRVHRAQIILGSADREARTAIARRLAIFWRVMNFL